MPRKKIDIKVLEQAWEFYLEDQSTKSIAVRLEAAGTPIHENTIRRWIKGGIPSRGVQPFAERLGEIKQNAERILEERKAQRVTTDRAPHLPSPQVEIIECDAPAGRAMIDNLTAQYLADNLEAYQALVDRTILHGHVGLEKVMTALLGTDPEDHQAMKNNTTALKNMVSSIRGAVETRLSLRGAGTSGGGPEADGMLMEHFEGWTPEEHRAFRDRGIWPESQGPPPEFLLSPPPEQPDPTDETAPEQVNETDDETDE
jgi:hypothetical protein